MPGLKTSKIWFIPREELYEVVSKSKYKIDILNYFGIKATTRKYNILNKRLIQENIDFSHIKLFTFQKPITDYLIYRKEPNNGYTKKRIIKEGLLKEQCVKCGLGTIWQNEHIILELDHINGDRKDNRLENLRFLCPNCRSQTNTYCGRGNKKKGTKKCKDCGEFISAKATRCTNCKYKDKIKIDPDELQILINQYSIERTASILNVSVSTISDRVKKFNIKPIREERYPILKLSKTKLKNLYDKYTIPDIAKQFNCPLNIVSQRLKEMNISTKRNRYNSPKRYINDI